jgi:hypothetical protein
MSDTGRVFGCLHGILIVLSGGSKPGLWRDVVGWLLRPSFKCRVVLSISAWANCGGNILLITRSRSVDIRGCVNEVTLKGSVGPKRGYLSLDCGISAL